MMKTIVSLALLFVGARGQETIIAPKKPGANDGTFAYYSPGEPDVLRYGAYTGRAVDPAATMYFEETTEALVFVKQSAYDKLKAGGELVASDYEDITPYGAYTYTTADKNLPLGKGTYAYCSMGVDATNCPDPNNPSPGCTGAYVGRSYYLAQAGTMSTQTNSFNIRGSMEPVCISDTKGGQCGKAKSYSAGDMKFALFGYSYGPGNRGLINGGGYDGLAYQLHVTAVNAGNDWESTCYTKNGKSKPLQSCNFEDITGIDFTYTDDVGKRATVSYTFEDKFNYGVVGPPGGPHPVTGTADIKVKPYWDATGLTLHYIFDVNVPGMKDQYAWWAYDPKFQSGSANGAPRGGVARVLALLVSVFMMTAFSF